MEKAFNYFEWENEPSRRTPIDQDDLNQINIGLNEVDNRVVALDVSKANEADMMGNLRNITLDNDTGDITKWYYDGTTDVIHTNLSKIATNWYYDRTTQRIILTLPGGGTEYIDLSSLISQYQFANSNTIEFSIDEEGNVSAEVKNGSITREKLSPDYLAEIDQKRAEAATYAEYAYNQSQLAKSYNDGDAGVRAGEETDNAKYYAEQAKNYAEAAQSVAQLTVPQFYIDPETMELMSDTEAKGMRFWLEDGYLYGEVTNG